MIGLFIGSIAVGESVTSPVAGVLMTAMGARSVPFILLALAMIGTVTLMAWAAFGRLSACISSSGSDDSVTERTSIVVQTYRECN